MLARVILVLALLLAPAATLAQAQSSVQSSGKAPAALRGREKPKPPVAPTPGAEEIRASLPSDIATGLLTSPAPPLAAPIPPTFGGAECRRACARDLYQCRVQNDEVDCNPAWMRCVLACPELSSSLP